MTELPEVSLEEFKVWVLDGSISPSVALRRLMEKYSCLHPDTSLPIQLIALVYPDVDISRCNFTFR